MSRTFTGLNSDQTADFTGAQVYEIFGQVTSSADPGLGIFDVTVTLSGSASATIATDATGFFTFFDLAPGNYTVTPSKAGFTFNPANMTFTNLSTDQFVNFTTASASFFTVSGQVTDASNNGVSNVTISMLLTAMFGVRTEAVQTDANGNYSFPNLQAGGNYTFTPTKPLLTFNPQSPTFNNLSGNQTVNFSASPASGLTGKIAFARFDEVGAQISTINADGTSETNLATLNTGCFGSGPGGGPAWSPDGARIAFSQCNASGRQGIYLMQKDGTNVTQLTDAPHDDFFPNWSPDSTRLTFTYGECSNGTDGIIPEIYSIDVASKIRTQLTNNSVVDATSDWSPNGASIAFARANSAASCDLIDVADIYTMDAAGGNEKLLTNGDSISYDPAYSPDGSRIAFVRETVDPIQGFRLRSINVMNIDGTGRTQITPNAIDAEKPTWSPDGTKIAFGGKAVDTNGHQIFVINVNGTGLTQVTNSDSVDREAPSWQHPACVAPPDNLVAWYAGDGNANDIALGNNGTLQGGVTSAPGIVGQAFNLNGTDAFVQAPNASAIDPTSAGSQDAWVYFNQLPSVAGHIMEIIGEGSSGRDFDLQADLDNRFHFYIAAGNNAVSTTVI